MAPTDTPVGTSAKAGRVIDADGNLVELASPSSPQMEGGAGGDEGEGGPLTQRRGRQADATSSRGGREGDKGGDGDGGLLIGLSDPRSDATGNRGGGV